MTGYESKRAAARDKLDDNDALTIAYQSGYYDGKKAAQRPWVGLTNEERSGIEDYCEMIIGKAAFDAIETALRSKNHE